MEVSLATPLLASHLLKTPSEVDCKSLSCQLKKYSTKSRAVSIRRSKETNKRWALSILLNIQEESFVVLQHFMYSDFDSTLSVFKLKSDTHFLKHVCVFVHQTYVSNVQTPANYK